MSTPVARVHGMGRDLVVPDWPALTGDEVAEVLARFGLSGGATVVWHSPRPMSAAGIVAGAGRRLFVKRHSRRVRDERDLAAEHRLADHLRAQGVPAPVVVRTPSGAGTTVLGDGVYEVQELAAGLDVYRDAPSWTPFASSAHARAAGGALARLHRATAGYREPARAPGVLRTSTGLVTADDPLGALGAVARDRPGLARGLQGRDWERDLRPLATQIGAVAPRLRALRPQWAHNDWHASNLTWSAQGDVAGVLDLGLANRTFAVHDLATAIERNTIAWLDLAAGAGASVDFDAVDALLSGYRQERRLSDEEEKVLPAVLPVVHAELALSELEYFADVVDSPINADLAYHGYLIGHARWFEGEGTALVDHLRAA